jgi:hypothetical protein
VLDNNAGWLYFLPHFCGEKINDVRTHSTSTNSLFVTRVIFSLKMVDDEERKKIKYWRAFIRA